MIFPESLKLESFSYQDIIGQDRWSSFDPVRTGWTDVGTPTVAGRFHIIGRQCFFQIEVVPSTSIATTAGTSYISLPITAEGLGGDASMVNLSTLVAVGTCVIDPDNSRVYVPTQGASGSTFTIGGWYEI